MFAYVVKLLVPDKYLSIVFAGDPIPFRGAGLLKSVDPGVDTSVHIKTRMNELHGFFKIESLRLGRESRVTGYDLVLFLAC